MLSINDKVSIPSLLSRFTYHVILKHKLIPIPHEEGSIEMSKLSYTEETAGDRKCRNGTEELTVLFLRRLAKGFLSGVGLYSGVKVISALMRNPFREK